MSSRPEEDLSCPICQDIFKDPVVLTCSHSFCRTCLQTWWRGKKTQECPCCKRKSSRSDPPRNLALRNLCEAFTAAGMSESEHLCTLHSEKLKIFCLDHQEPVCVICRDSRIHSEHRFRPVDEAAQEHREELQKILKPLQDKLAVLQDAKADGDQTLKFIRLQSQQTEKQIREQFQKLYKFLQQEERAKVAALQEEEARKSGVMKEKVAALSREIAVLSATITAAQAELKAADVSFLKNYQETVRRVQRRPLQDDPQPVPRALIDVVQHLGNLTFNIWSSMKRVVFYNPVVLDPNTADLELVLSSDLSSVRSGERKQLPRNPERTRFSCSVLGSQGFTSGTHSWSVDVGENQDWELGVLGDAVQTGGAPAAQLWRISFCQGKLTVFSGSEPETELPLKAPLRKIGVHLDVDRGRLSFSNHSTNTNIHTFTHSFSTTLFPYIYTEDPVPVRLLPASISVSVNKNA
ncbi:nuclear factor 7, ovary-like [Poeciliopsis prolifica]|uniref:nuclear factor 7, ovary-like n=1 Tax=Poeciliopsis prolifica TaxID=188132 RepID=UPI00241382BD|nr:nuclear factor 7, ovary-like [Poeciliopsis prolifica]